MKRLVVKIAVLVAGGVISGYVWLYYGWLTATPVSEARREFAYRASVVSFGMMGLCVAAIVVLSAVIGVRVWRRRQSPESAA